MTKKQKDRHIIQKQIVQVEMENAPDAFAFRNQLSSLYHDRIFPRLSDIFDAVCPADRLITLDTLEIDLGKIAPDRWEHEMVWKTLQTIKAKLLAADKKKLAEDTDQFIEMFFYFLRFGRLLWNSRIETVEELEQVILLNKSFIKELKKSVGQKNVLERLVYRFSEKFCEKIITVLSADQQEIQEAIFSLLNRPDMHPVRPIMLQWFIRSLAEEKTKVTVNILNKLDQEDSAAVAEIFKKEITIAFTEKEVDKPQDEEEAIYIQNAGLVILHPFLPEFFERLTLTFEGKWKDATVRHDAVWMLEIFVNNENKSPEFNLLLNKILCGMDTDEVLMPGKEMGGEVRSGCEELLSEVIRHWKILRGTSMESLQETFLQREGKLRRVNEGWLLQVEQKGVDILLNSLPWGLGVIRLPWMKENLYVEWI